MMIRIFQKRAKCIGCNACVEVAPYRWRMSRMDGKCTLVGGKENKGFFMFIAGDDELQDAQKAAKVCPSNIIQVQQIK
ncbi:MAG: ferredoxin [Chitinophagaceae bacterium]